MVTARDFIAHVYIPLLQAWGYIYGTAGRMWTEALQKAWSQPGHKNYEQTKTYGSRWIGRMVTDCSGLLCWALKQLGVSIAHQARYQYTDASARKGKLINGKREDGSPILPGTAVFLKGDEERIHHVGVYVGHGICIEAKGTRWGVVTSELTHWDYWGELKAVDYTDAARLEEEPVPEIPDQKSDVMYRVIVDNPGAWLNVRSGPGTTYPVKFRLEKGDTADVLAISEDGKWDQIRCYSSIGWASAEYLRILDEDQGGDPDQEQTDDPEDSDLSGNRDELTGEMEGLISRIRGDLQMLENKLYELKGE
jgi:hypothetical protein